MTAKHLGYWAQSVVPGIENMVLGERNDRGDIINIETISLTSLAIKNAGEWTPKACFEFENRLLTWIKSHFLKNDLENVKCFSYTCGDSRVTVTDATKKSLPLAEEIERLIL